MSDAAAAAADELLYRALPDATKLLFSRMTERRLAALDAQYEQLCKDACAQAYDRGRAAGQDAIMYESA